MGGEYIGSYFFVPLGDAPESDEELFDRLGYERRTRMFGGLHVTEHRADRLSDHVCAQLYFLASELREIGMQAADDVPVANDPALPLAVAIRDGAVRARAEVAILATRDAVLAKILERYWMVLVGDATALAAERFGLTYLAEGMVQDWDPPAVHLDRDELPGGPGRMLFSSRGSYRWY
jgi:hypothetical protein